MSGRRRFRPASIGLFFFQDIVFLATGIFLLVSVCFALSTRLDQISVEALEERPENRDALLRELVLLEEEIRLGKLLDDWLTAGIPSPSPLPQKHSSLLLENSITLSGVPSRKILPAITSPADLATANEAVRDRFHQIRERVASPAIAMVHRENEYKSIRAATLALEERRNRILVHPGDDGSLSEPVFLLLGGDSLTLEWLDRPELTRHISAPFTTATLQAAFASFRPEHQLFLLMVRPSGAGEFAAIRRFLTGEEFLIGYEPVPENFELNLNLDDRIIDIIR